MACKHLGFVSHQRKNNKPVIQKKTASVDRSRDDAEANCGGRQDEGKASRSDNHMAQVVMVIAVDVLGH